MASLFDAVKKELSAYTDPKARKEYLAKYGRDSVTNIKQAAQGLALPFMDAPNLPRQNKPDGSNPADGYSPVALDFIPALVGTVQQVVDPNGQDNMFRQSADRVVAASDTLNSKLGIGNPEGWQQVGSNILGGLIIPAKGGNAKTVVKAASNLGKGGKVANAVKTTAKVAAETLVPFRQTGIKTAVATQLPLGLGLNAAVGAYAKGEQKKAEEPISLDVDQLLSEDAGPVSLDVDELLADDSPDAPVSLDMEDLLAEDEVQNSSHWWEEHPFQAIGLTALALGAGVAGVKTIQANAAKKTAAAFNHPSLGPKLSGVENVKPTTDFATETMGALAQADQPMRVAVRNATKDKAVRSGFEARRDLVNAIPLNGKITAAMSTGEMPNSALNVTPVKTTYESMAKELTEAEQVAVSEGLLARATLDDIKTNKVQSAFNQSSQVELQAKADLIENNPKLNKYATAVKQHERDLLDYMEEQGMVTSKAKADWIKARPNYVHMSRNRTDGSAASSLFGYGQNYSPDVDRVDSLLKRSTEEFGGVQNSAAADPIRDLPARYAAAIKAVELNRSKTEFFDILEQNNAFRDNAITKVPVGTKPKTTDGLITITRNGIDEHYIVKDPSLFAALDASPHLLNGMLKVADGVTQAFQLSTTGNANPFFALTAMMNDTVAGRSLVPEGRTTGLINEVAARAGLPGLGKLDPTHWVAAPVGALRIAIDELPMALASGLSSKLVQNVPGLKGMLDAGIGAVGGGNADALALRLAAQYKKSIQYNMLKYGAANSGYTNVGPNGLGTAFADIAPEQFSRLSKLAYEEALANNPNPLQQATLTFKYAAEQARANGFVRLYMNTLKAMQEGYRYQFVATNLPKALAKGADDVELLMAQSRSSAADMAKTGNSAVLSQSKAIFSYINPSIQSNVAQARAFKAAPLNYITNKAVLYSSLIALQYGAIAANPELVEDVKNLTDDMQTRMAVTFGGLRMPITQEDRLVWGQLTAMINDISGISRGELDPDWKKVFEDLVESGISEEGMLSMGESLKAAIASQIPSSPITNTAGAFMGMDVGMTNLTGEPQEIKSQTVDALGGKGKYAGDPISAGIRTVINSILGTSIAYHLDTVLATARAMGEGLSEEEVFDIAKERFKDNTVRASGMAKNTLFGNYESVESVNDTDFRMWYKKKDGIDQAKKIYDEQFKRPDTTGASKYALPVSRKALPGRTAQGSVLEPIGQITEGLISDTYQLERELGSLKNQISYLDSAIKDDPNTTEINESKIEERNARINDINVQRKELTEQLNMLAKDAEGRIREVTGIADFTYQNFGDGKKYEAMPLPVPQ